MLASCRLSNLVLAFGATRARLSIFELSRLLERGAELPGEWPVNACILRVQGMVRTYTAVACRHRCTLLSCGGLALLTARRSFEAG